MEANSSSSSRTSSPKDIAKLSFWELFERSEKKELKLKHKQEMIITKDNESRITCNSKLSSFELDKTSNSTTANSIPSFAQKLSDFTTQHLPYCISSKLSQIVSPIVNNESLFTHVFMPNSNISILGKEASCENGDRIESNARQNLATTNLIAKLKTREGSKKYQKYLLKHPNKAVKIFDIIKKDIKEFGLNEPAKNFYLQLYSLLPQAQKQENWNIFANQISFKCQDNSSSIIIAVLDKKVSERDEEMILSAFSEHICVLAYCKNGVNFLLKLLSSFSLITLKPLIDYIRSHLMQLLSDNESVILVKKAISLMKEDDETDKEDVINLFYENPIKSMTEKQSANILILIMTEWGIHKVERFIHFIEADLIHYVENEHSNKFIKCLIERNEKVSAFVIDITI